MTILGIGLLERFAVKLPTATLFNPRFNVTVCAATNNSIPHVPQYY